MKYCHRLLWTAAALLLGPDYWAYAQAQEFVLEEIIVTARRREENLMQVPIAISAFSAEDLESNAAFDLVQLSDYTPGMFAVPGGNGRPDRGTIQLTFRGLSVSTGLVFIDGAPYTGGLTPNLQGVERVEVLKGPQSAYFGRSTFSGAVNFVTKGVPDEFEGRLRAEVSEFGGSDTSISLGGPIVKDRLSLAVNYRHYYLGGYYKNAYNPTDRLGQQQTDSVNAVVNFEPTDKLAVKVYLDYTRDNDGGPYAIALKANKDIFCDAGGTYGVYHCGALPSLNDIDPNIISADTEMDPYTYDILINNSFNLRTNHFDPKFNEAWGLKRDAYVAHLNVDYDLENDWSVSGLFAFHKTKSQNLISPDYRNGRDTPNLFNILGIRPLSQTYHRFGLLQQTLQQDINAELRLTSPQDARLRGTLGFNYLHLRSPGGNIYGVSPLGPIGTGTVTKTRSNTPAIFGGVYYDLTDKITLGAEARYQADKVSSETVEPVVGVRLGNTFKSFSPRVSLDYKYSDDSMAYALFSSGYRPGGFNGSLVGQPATVLAQLQDVGIKVAFDEERLDNYEIGFKSTWFDGRARTTIALYHDIWVDGQVRNTTFFRTPDGSIQQTTVTTNQGSVKMNGIEFEASFAATQNLTVDATLGYSDATFKVFPYVPKGPQIQGSSDIIGNRLDQAPKWMWSISPQYSAPLMGEYDWFARIDYRHRGRFFTDATNIAWVPTNDLFNVRFGITDGTLKLELYAENVLNDKSLIGGRHGNDALGFSEKLNNRTNEIRSILPNPRVLGIRANYDF